MPTRGRAFTFVTGGCDLRQRRYVTRKASFAPVAAPDARLLILGSLPGDRSLAEQRYYAHPQNQFWWLIGAVIGVDLLALEYDRRLAALIEHRIALWDVVASAQRTGSADMAIREPIPNDLAALAASLADLRAVAFNGATAYRQGAAALADAGLNLLPLPSSSPLHTIGLAAKLPAWLTLRRYLEGRPPVA